MQTQLFFLKKSFSSLRYSHLLFCVRISYSESKCSGVIVLIDRHPVTYTQKDIHRKNLTVTTMTLDFFVLVHTISYIQMVLHAFIYNYAIIILFKLFCLRLQTTTLLVKAFHWLVHCCFMNIIYFR